MQPYFVRWLCPLAEQLAAVSLSSLPTSPLWQVCLPDTADTRRSLFKTLCMPCSALCVNLLTCVLPPGCMLIITAGLHTSPQLLSESAHCPCYCMPRCHANTQLQSLRCCTSQAACSCCTSSLQTCAVLNVRHCRHGTRQRHPRGLTCSISLTGACVQDLQRSFGGEQLAYIATLAVHARLLFGDRPKRDTYHQLLTQPSIADLDAAFATQVCSCSRTSPHSASAFSMAYLAA